MKPYSCLSPLVVGLHPSAVLTALDIPYPSLIVKIPQDGFSQAFFKRVCGIPAEFRGQFYAVDRIAEIVSGAIRHECNKICVWAFARGAHRIEHVTDAVNDLKVGALGVVADVISLSHPARFKHALNSGTMILYMEPVTDVVAGSIYGERLAGQSIERNQRNKFFRKLARAIVIRTIGDERGKAVGFVESPDKMVTGSF